jgi:6-phosphogluconolactonase
MPKLHIAKDSASWIEMSARFITDIAQAALLNADQFVLALSGGSTPRPVYQALPEFWEECGLDWDRTHILWSDERCVPLNHPQSNYHMTCEALITKIHIPSSNIHPMRCGNNPDESAETYEAILHDLYPHQAWPLIDLCLLGMGTDGHTASLFPGSPALSEQNRWVVSNHAPGIEHWRLTLTIPAINNSRSVAFLVAGENKAETLRKVLHGTSVKNALPIQRIQPVNQQPDWLLDADAARLIKDL